MGDVEKLTIQVATVVARREYIYIYMSVSDIMFMVFDETKTNKKRGRTTRAGEGSGRTVTV